ncbi:hypothetical protein APUTEX25_001174, partial [Auxenochlorella protothecoides]
NGHPVGVVHLVELVDADHAAVRQHHRPGLQPALTCASGQSTLSPVSASVV